MSAPFAASRESADIETLYARENAAFTLRFTAEGRTLDLTFGHAVVGRLFQRWMGHAPREGIRVIPFISPDDGAGLKAADAQFQFGHCAPGYVHVRLASDGGDFEARLEGLVGMDVVYPDAACERDANGRTTLRKDLHPGFAGLRDSECEYAVYVASGHQVSPVCVEPAGEGESAGRETAPPMKPMPPAYGGFDTRFVTWMDGPLAALADPALTRLVANFGNLRAVIEGERG
ncbi:hypothetical protein [Brevundimonas nasdae]|uniref:Uncharacterized protein n=1 Tax=Brevundimonas nasdae TaxID=172043 RepID=A0ABX8TJK0_9CAUL|nr:hypothetical protein [Brevundimonas nasdae]QYC10585.1 hypothetical protein KWG56_00735 [Brevundimonas nasdae]QYC13372.1 hypothetical protein KWG63_14290 [Brevundimonas nasdae]